MTVKTLDETAFECYFFIFLCRANFEKHSLKLNITTGMGSTKKIILVEDNRAEADLTRIIYKEQAIACEIIQCENGE